MKKILVVLCFFLAPIAIADDTGYIVFTAASGTGWTNDSNALTDDSNYAFDDVGEATVSTAFDFTGADLSAIPDSATIDMVEFRLKRTGEDSGSHDLFDNEIYLLIEGSTSGANQAVSASWGDASVETADYTMPSTGYTTAQLKAATSGIRVKVEEDGGSGNSMARLYVGLLKVTYTTAGGSSHPWYFFWRR